MLSLPDLAELGNRIPLTVFLVPPPITWTLRRETLRLFFARVCATCSITSRDLLPDIVRSSITVEYLRFRWLHACLIGSSIAAKKKFARRALVDEPWGRWRSKVVNLVRRSETLAEQPKTSRHTQYTCLLVMLG